MSRRAFQGFALLLLGPWLGGGCVSKPSFSPGPADPDAPPIPGIAPAAKQMGRYAGRLIATRVAGRETPPPFVYRHYLDLAAIGRKSAVVRRGRLHLTGFVAWLFWGVAHIYFLIGARNRFVVAINWIWNYLTFQRGARVITERGA